MYIPRQSLTGLICITTNSDLITASLHEGEAPLQGINQIVTLAVRKV